jgi:hypothetical protein
MTTRPLGAIWPTSSRPGRCSCPSGFRSSWKYSISAHVISEKDITGASVKTYDVQHNDGRIERFSIVDKSGDESVTAEQPRQFAAVLTETADEVDRLGKGVHSVPSATSASGRGTGRFSGSGKHGRRSLHRSPFLRNRLPRTRSTGGDQQIST